jgi:hypothetical protein
MKRINDFSSYTQILPYASEIFGVYQPLLGWKSRRIRRRIDKGFANDTSRLFDVLRKRFKGNFEFTLDERNALSAIDRVEPAELKTYETRFAGSFVLEGIASTLPPIEKYNDSVWDRAIQPTLIKQLLDTTVIPEILAWHKTALAQNAQPGAGLARGQGRPIPNLNELVAEQLDHESTAAGYVLYLKEKGHFATLKDLFYKADDHLHNLTRLIGFRDPLEYMDPFKDIDRAGLSPIGIVHLFRQYFFEFDTFLGPPVSHVWMSPGATVELVEISTRKSVVERSFETESEIIVKTEKTLSQEEELSDAVKEDNKSDTKFGVSATANQSWIGGSASASSSIDMGNTQSKAREVTHRRMRQQTEKLSTEIRKNYKSTFKTVTEVTDTSSKRYILSNTTDKLINYELRRKMRQVGVQVQDIGTYLCWQTYVDDPGRQLGIAKLVHLAKSPELGGTPPPEAVPMPTSIVTQHNIDIPFIPETEDTLPADDMDEAYKDGKEVNLDDNEGTPEKIQANFDGLVAECDQTGYQYAGTIVFDYGSSDITLSVRNLSEVAPGKITYGIHLDHVNFRNVSPLRVVAKVTWAPTQDVIDSITAANKQKTDEFNEQSKHEYEKAFVEAARDRINKASNIASRKFEDLREEERIVVYRCLIQEMLTKDIPMPDERTRHVVSELLNTIFDIDKMLYFVAPEWWKPRLHRSHQVLGGLLQPAASGGGATTTAAAKPASVFGQKKATAVKNAVSSLFKPVEDSQIAPTHIVSWGGTQANRVDNYYITEESEPARLGSSLGWLLQLDGDNLRNAFLNAPWVKAVIPIRPGKERAAINWLQRLHVEGTEGLDDNYLAPNAELAEIPHTGPAVTVRDAINHLCGVVAEKHEASLEVKNYPTEEINDDNKVSATPVDKVYEHGFYPLQGGFRVMPGEEDFEIFDQWVEVLPTDQVVPVEVAYDPKTGRQI